MLQKHLSKQQYEFQDSCTLTKYFNSKMWCLWRYAVHAATIHQAGQAVADRPDRADRPCLIRPEFYTRAHFSIRARARRTRMPPPPWVPARCLHAGSLRQGCGQNRVLRATAGSDWPKFNRREFTLMLLSILRKILPHCQKCCATRRSLRSDRLLFPPKTTCSRK